MTNTCWRCVVAPGYEHAHDNDMEINVLHEHWYEGADEANPLHEGLADAIVVFCEANQLVPIVDGAKLVGNLYEYGYMIVKRES